MAQTALKALIIDDEELARENLRMMLEDHCPGVEVVGLADGVNSARTMIAELRPDLLFLDIRMPSGSEGLDLLLHYDDPDFLVIFVTAFKDHAIKAFNANAIHYVLKPIDATELVHAVEKAIARRADDPIGRHRSLRDLVLQLRTLSGQERITIDHSKGFKVFDPDRMVHLDADGNCTLIHFTDGTRYLDSRNLKVYEELLGSDHFLRVHRSHLINVRELREYLRENGHFAVMSDGSRVPIARNRLEEFMGAIRGKQA